MSETVIRPNGKPYRRRTPIAVDSYDDGYETAVVVLGTHDEAVAYPLACRHWSWLGVGDMALEPWPEPPTWLRKVPFDIGTGFDSNYITDEVRGRPALVYREARMPKSSAATTTTARDRGERGARG